MQLLRYRPRSMNEARTRLRTYGFSEKEIEETLKRASEARLLDDALFARLWVQDRLHSHPLSRRAVRQELSDKGIADSIVEEVLAEHYPPEVEDRALYELAHERHKRYRGLDRERRLRRLTSYLTRRGFPFSAARKIAMNLENRSDVEED
jgi:regulatory protein